MNLAIFDIDGTLVAENEVEDGCYLAALETVFGFHAVDPDWANYNDVTDSGLAAQLCIDRLGRGPTVDELGRFRDVYCSLMIQRLRPDDGGEITGARAFVADLRSRPEWRVAIATGNFHQLAVHKLQRAGIPCLDVPMATADDASGRSTLVGLAASRAQSRYGVPSFDYVVFVGDAPWDLRAARELRMPFLAVGSRCGGSQGETQMISDYVDSASVMLRLAGAICW